ncbi:MAG: ferritin-like domain-containing protein [Sphingomonadaceae bacterium]
MAKKGILSMVMQPGRVKIWEDRLRDIASKGRQNLEEGMVTESYKANKDQVIQILNRALASEWIAFMQYWHHYFMATDIHSPEIREMFKDAAGEELHHIEEIGERVQALGGVPVDKPEDITQQWIKSVDYGHDLRSMLEIDLADERATVAFYSEIVRFCGFDDIVTRSMFEEILREEEEHANTLADILYAYDSSTNRRTSSLHQQVAEEAIRIPQQRAA